MVYCSDLMFHLGKLPVLLFTFKLILSQTNPSQTNLEYSFMVLDKTISNINPPEKRLKSERVHLLYIYSRNMAVSVPLHLKSV